jgi:acyl-CoA thioester hydrolase
MDRQALNRVSYRVLYGDTDKMGVVYYANYLRWFERGRGEFLRQLGIPYISVEQRDIHFPVIEVSCRYFRSAQYDELITIETQLLSLTRATLSFSYRILCETEPSLLAAGSTKHACINSQGRILRIPADLWPSFEAALAPASGAGAGRPRR